MHENSNLKENRKKIPESELILNERGAIYHLDLRPEEIADTIITVGDPARVKKVSQYFDDIICKRKHREFKTHTGIVNDRKISVISTGIGTDNIDIVMNEIDALFNIDFETRQVKEEKKQLKFIRIGTSGAMQEDIAIDTFVANEAGIGLDGLAFFYGEKIQHYTKSGIPYYIAKGSPELIQTFGSRIEIGTAITASGFYAPQGRNIRLSGNFREEIDALRLSNDFNPRVTNMEMETAGMYYLADILGHQAISLNAILANRVTGEFSSHGAETIDRLIRFVLQEFRME